MPLASSASEGNSGDRAHRTTCSKKLWDQFSKQDTPGHRTIFSLRFAICIFLSMSVAFLIGGGILLSYSLAQVQIRVTYSDSPPLRDLTNEERSRVMQGQTIPNGFGNGTDLQLPLSSLITINITQDMDAPIHIYYILHSFYQNHKRYVRSVSYDQLHGSNESASSLPQCKPQLYLTGDSNDTLPQRGLINPCGLTAWSLFNDTFSGFEVVRSGDTTGAAETITVDSSKLVWASDRDTFFGSTEPVNHNTLEDGRGGAMIEQRLNEAEHFMAWMRVAAHPDVRKFYGTIDTDLKDGDQLSFYVGHQFNTYEFDGEKELLLTTAGPFGNRNLTLGVVWLAMGALTGVITFVYIALGWHQLWSPERRIEDLQRRWAKGEPHFSRNHTASFIGLGETKGR